MVKKFKLRFYINNCLFGSVKLIKNSEPDKHKYSCYSIGFDSRSEFSFTYGSKSLHIDDENKDILILGEGPAQRLDNTTLTAY